MQFPVEFEVSDVFFDEEERCLLLGGEVPAEARVTAGMKLSVAVNRRFAVELAIERLVELGEKAGRRDVAVWIEAVGEAELSMLRGLRLDGAELLIWDADVPVDPSRHFAAADSYAELVIDLGPQARGERAS